MNTLARVPLAQNKQDDVRLIDRGLEALEVSSSGLAERYSQGRTTHSGQVWWARRPHAAMRALVFAVLCKSQSAYATELLVSLANERGDLHDLYAAARALLASDPLTPPVVLDMFGGGGTIAHEAAALGAKALSLDYSPLATFLQQVNLSWSQAAFSEKGKSSTLALLQKIGREVLAAAALRTDCLFPARQLASSNNEPFAYFWSYSHACKACGYSFSLSKRRWLSKKAGRELRFHLVDEGQGQSVDIEHGDTDEQATAWVGRRGLARCPKCSVETDKISIKDCADDLLATAALHARRKVFKSTKGASLSQLYPDSEVLDHFIGSALRELQFELPESTFPKWSGIVNPAMYGIETHAEIFNRRQQAVTLAVCAEILKAHVRISSSEGVNVARFITGSLSALVDQLVDWNSRLSMWIPQNEQVGRGFCGPGISMLWDYVESDPFSIGPSNLNDKLKRICNAAAVIPVFEHAPEIINGTAQRMPVDDASVDAIVTDPPYYDNMFYSVLSDSFYAWKRPIIRTLALDLALQQSTPASLELVASKQRQGSSGSAHSWYCEQLSAAVAEAQRTLKPNGIFALVYGHSSLLGWQAILAAYRESGLVIESVEPLAIERRARPRAMTSEAVNTCVVLVARKRPNIRKRLTLEQVAAEELKHAREPVAELRAAGWSDADIGMACFAKGVGRLAAIDPIDGVDDLTALRRVASEISVYVPGFQMKERGSI